MQFIQTEEPQQQVSPFFDRQNMPATNMFNDKAYMELLKHYTEEEGIPQEMRESRWAIFSKALPLTFLDDKDMLTVDFSSRILRIDNLMNVPPHRVTFDETYKLDQIEFFMFLQAKRAVGTKENKMNERTLQNTQIAQSISSQTMLPQRSSGFMSKVRGMF